VSFGKSVEVENASENVPVPVVPGILSPSALNVAVPLALEVDPTAEGTLPEAGVSIIAPLAPVVHTM